MLKRRQPALHPNRTHLKGTPLTPLDRYRKSRRDAVNKARGVWREWSLDAEGNRIPDAFSHSPECDRAFELNIEHVDCYCFCHPGSVKPELPPEANEVNEGLCFSCGNLESACECVS